jgi:hypothetical protein
VCLKTRRDDHISGDSSNSHYLAAFNYFPTVAFWLLAGNAALLALIKADTSGELVIGRFREPHPVPSGLSANHAQRRSPTVRKDVTPLNRKPGGLMEQNNASLQRGDQG